MKWYMQTSRKNYKKGFSLIELIVSVGLFAIVMTVSVGTLLVLVNANQKALSLKSVINNINFELDSMSRNIRTGRSYYCTNDDIMLIKPLPSGVADCANGAVGLVLTDDHGKRIGYRFGVQNGTLSIQQSVDNGVSWGSSLAPEVVIDDMLFYVTGTDTTDTLQPTVTISLLGHVGIKAATDSPFNIQTTLTQRLLDK